MEIIYAIWISAIATGVIAIFTGLNLWLILTIKSRDDEFRQRVSDLYLAIVISNISGSPREPDLSLKFFNKHYKYAGGKTKIFEKESQEKGD